MAKWFKKWSVFDASWSLGEWAVWTARGVASVVIALFSPNWSRLWTEFGAAAYPVAFLASMIILSLCAVPLAKAVEIMRRMGGAGSAVGNAVKPAEPATDGRDAFTEPEGFLDRVSLQALPAGFSWWADIRTAKAASKVTVSLDWQEHRGGTGEIQYGERRRKLLAVLDFVGAGDDVQIDLIREFNNNGHVYLGWCLRGWEKDADSTLEIGRAYTRCRLVITPDGGPPEFFAFVLEARERDDQAPKLWGEHHLAFAKEWPRA